MGTFNASLKTPGDRTGLPATLQVERGRLRINAGDTPIGDWSRDELSLEPIAGGFRLAVEGELIVLEMDDADAFEAEMVPKAKEKAKPERKRRAKRKREPKGRRKEPKTPEPEAAKAEPARKPKEKPNPVAAVLDRVIDFAERKLGTLLPSWVFTRAVVLAVILVLVLTAVFPGPLSVVVLVAGLIGILAGAVVYSDSALASKLPGRTRPDHVLIAGLIVMVFGILLRLLARWL